MVKVLYLINSLGAGGAEQSLAEMLPLLPQHGIDPVVATLYRAEEGFEERIAASEVPVHFLEGRSWCTWWRELRTLLDDQRPDVLHTTIFEADVVGRLAAVGLKARVVGSLVNTSYGPERRQDPAVSGLKLEAARRLDSWTARHLTHRFHALTASVKEHAIQRLGIPHDRIVVVPRGRDPQRLGVPSPERRARVRQQMGIADEEEVILNVGRQEFQKDHATLLAAFAILARHRPRALLLQAGRAGGQTSSLRAQAASIGLGDRVRFLGHRQDIADLLAAADVFAFPSRFEGMGGSVIEAMALGVPVVASDLPVLREVVEPGRSALLVPTSSPEPLADAVNRVLEDPSLRCEMGACAQAIFRDRYDLEATTSRLVDALYTEPP